MAVNGGYSVDSPWSMETENMDTVQEIKNHVNIRRLLNPARHATFVISRQYPSSQRNTVNEIYVPEPYDTACLT